MCGTPIQHPLGKGGQPLRTCSEECRARVEEVRTRTRGGWPIVALPDGRDGREHTCRECGSTFVFPIVRGRTVGTTRYCAECRSTVTRRMGREFYRAASSSAFIVVDGREIRELLCVDCGESFLEEIRPMRPARCRPCRRTRARFMQRERLRHIYRTDAEYRLRHAEDTWRRETRTAEPVPILDLWRDQDGRCYLCGEAMHPLPILLPGDRRDPRLVSVDHVIPLSRGGTHTPDNVQLACWICNTRKNARTPDEYRRRVRI